MQLVIHAPFGARINRAWGLALRKRFCRSFNFELQAAATDNGIVISLGEQHSFPLEIVFEFLRPATVEEVLTQAVLPAPMFTARWRWNASRALAILRFQGGRKVPPPIQRMRADDLLAAVFPDQAACPENLTGDVRIPDHPLVNETIANCLHEAMDLDGLRAVLAAIHDGAIRTVAIDTPEPSPFSHEILNSNPYAYLDDAPLEERRARMVQMRRTLPDDRRRRGRAGCGGHRPGGRRGVAAHARRRGTPRSVVRLESDSGGTGGRTALTSKRLAAASPRHHVDDGRPRFLGCRPSASIWCFASTRMPPSTRPSRRRRRRRAIPSRPKPAPPKSCAAGSNAPVRCALPTWRKHSPCRASWWTRRWPNWKPKARFCAGGSRRTPLKRKSNGATATCWRAFTG